ncbi:MAG TPA: PD-(D/E)XK nuclease family protein [Victivallales bacterium]|nr:PD-(D/E)XK nuclease family protein [Victivallales bacterium]
MRVTELLKKYGYIDDKYFTKEMTDRGTEAHRELAEYTLTNRMTLNPYLDSYTKFLTDFRVKIIQVEKRLEYNGISGTPDYVCIINGHRAIIDIKTGNRQKWWGIQLQAYKWLYEKNYPDERIIILQDIKLTTTEKYTVYPVELKGEEFYIWQKILKEEGI